MTSTLNWPSSKHKNLLPYSCKSHPVNRVFTTAFYLYPSQYVMEWKNKQEEINFMLVWSRIWQFYGRQVPVLLFSSHKIKYIVFSMVPNARFCFPACTASWINYAKQCLNVFVFYHLPHYVHDVVVFVIFSELCVKVLKTISLSVMFCVRNVKGIVQNESKK